MLKRLIMQLDHQSINLFCAFGWRFGQCLELGILTTILQRER